MTTPDKPDRKPRKPRQAVVPRKPREPLATIPPVVMAQAANGGAPVTSLAMATRHQVDRDHYTVAEQQAAKPAHAMDYGLNRNANDALTFVEATGWPGFQALALLAQLPEYRTMHETLADEVVRTWGKITSTSKDEFATDKITKLTEAIERYGLRSLVRTGTIHDQAFGGAHIFPRLTKGADSVPADGPLLVSPAFVAEGSLQSFSAVEPLWVTPNSYNATDPTKPDFYKPTTWMLLGTQVHASRLFTVISRPVSDLLKATYSFRGVSISQLAMPYVDNWLRTRQSVSDTVKQFSITYLKTDLAQLLAPGGAQSIFDRVQFMNLMRDNRNIGICDFTSEDFAQINTPLSGLDALQGQAMEQLCAVSHQPLVKQFGITPAGLNANSDGEIRVWYDHVAGYQSHNWTPFMTWALKLIQLSEFGEIDPGLSWDWNPLYELDDKELADVREKNARTDQVYFDMGVVSGENVQERLAADPNSGYVGIDTELSTPPEEVEALAREMAASATQDDPDAQDPDEPDTQGNSTSGRNARSNR